MIKELVKAIADLEEEEALRITKEKLLAGESPHKVLEDSRTAMEIVGKRFADGEYFIPDLIYSGEILEKVSEIVKPKLKDTLKTRRLSKFIIGTVAGDIHDIGKNIVAFMFDVSGFEVYDLGVDVPAQKFIDKIAETGATIVGLSGLLTLAFDSMKETIKAIETAGLRDKVKIMIGGCQVDEVVRIYTNADAYCIDPMSGIALAKEWAGGR